MNENIEIKIADWNSICSVFTEMFDGLGKIDVTDDIIAYQSIKPHVATGISLDRKGRLLANMPLHSIETEFEIVHFLGRSQSIKLIGKNSTYVYKIPQEIINSR